MNPSQPTRFTRPSAGKPLAAILATSLALTCSSSAELLVHEPFDYPTGTASGNGVLLDGQGGGIGMTGSWSSFSGSAGFPVTVYQEGTLSNVILTTSVANIFDGTVDNLPTSGGYAGSYGSGSPGGTDHAQIWRTLDPSVTATFVDGTTTWFSFVSARAYNPNARSPSFAIGADKLVEDRGNTALGEAIGGGGRNRQGSSDVFGSTMAVFPQYWDQVLGSPGETGGNFNHQNVIGGGTILAADAMVWERTYPDLSESVPNIIVGKIEWHDGSPDVISVVRFVQTDELTEAAFDALIVAQPNLSSANWPEGIQRPDLDQSQFDTISVGGGKYFTDEIRIATTFAEATGQSAPEPFTLWVAQDDPNLDFTWESQAGKLYRLRSSTALDTEFSTWDLVAEDLPNTAPLGSTSILKPGDSTLFYRMEEYPAPPLAVYSEDFDGVTAPAFPTDWTTGAQGPDTGTTFWELGDPTGGVANGPAAPNSPSNCVGTNIATNHGFDTDIWLRTNAIDLTTYTEASLTFQQFKEIEDVGIDLDYGSIRILDASDNSELAVLENQSVEGDTNGAWAAYTKALPAAAFTVPIKIEFRFQADDIDNFAGWYIDDLAITIPAP